MRISSTVGMLALVVLLLALPALVACGGNGDGEKSPTSTAGPTKEPTPAKKKTITIGNLTDLTGVSSSALIVMNTAMKDVIDYYDENNLIPGIDVKVVEYDGNFDPAKAIPGWQWLRERGASLIFTAAPPNVPVLKTVADNEKVPFFTATAGMDVLTPPGYTFSLGTIPQWEAYTLMKWIAENDWDYKTKGPAKIGGAAWEEPLILAFFDAMKEYAQAYPDQFEFVGGYTAPLSTFAWGTQVEALKNADYVYPCTAGLVSFAREYHAAGGKAKFIGDGPHAAFMGLVDDARAWGNIDGMLLVMATKWWNDEGELIDFTKELLYKNHPGSADQIIRTGTGYLTTYLPFILLAIIADAAETVGPENVDSQAISDAAESFSLTVDDVEVYSFVGKRSVSSYYRIMEVREDGKDLFSVSDWLPVVTEP